MRKTTWWQRLVRRRDAASPPLGGFATVTGGRVHYLIDGPAAAGEAVVLIHGASGNLRDFALGLMPALARRHRVIALDRPGFGHSTPVAGSERLSVQVRVLRDAVRRLGATRLHLVGHSYGGAVALAWALDHGDEIASLSLVSGVSMDWGGALGRTYHLASAPVIGPVIARAASLAPPAYVRAQLADIFAPDPVPPRYRVQAGVDLALRPGTFRLNARQITALHPQIVSMMPRYDRIACPVTLVHGSADHVVPADIHARGLAGRIPQARLVTLKGAGHMPHHAHAERVAEAVEGAIRAAAPQGGPAGSDDGDTGDGQAGAPGARVSRDPDGRRRRRATG